MLLNLLREIEDRNTKLGWCLERCDTTQALAHHAEIRRLIIEAAVLVLRADDGKPCRGGVLVDSPAVRSRAIDIARPPR